MVRAINRVTPLTSSNFSRYSARCLHRRVAAQVDPLESKGLKPFFSLDRLLSRLAPERRGGDGVRAVARVETRRVQARWGNYAFDLYSPMCSPPPAPFLRALERVLAAVHRRRVPANHAVGAALRRLEGRGALGARARVVVVQVDPLESKLRNRIFK